MEADTEPAENVCFAARPVLLMSLVSCKNALELPKCVISFPDNHDGPRKSASDAESGPGDAWFKTTHWSSVFLATVFLSVRSAGL